MFFASTSTSGEESSIDSSQKHVRSTLQRLATTEGVPMPTLYLPSHGSSSSHATPTHHHHNMGGGASSGGGMGINSSGSSSSAPDGRGSGGGRGRMGVIELLLYNMSSTLASVAAGYDVRLSNVMPIHPKLHPR